MALAVVATLTSGALPAWLGTRTTTSDVLREGDRGSSEGRAARRLTSMLIVGEIAVAVTLLVGAALMVRTFMALANVEKGIDTRNVALLQVNLPSFHLADPQHGEVLASEIHDRLALLPGVVRVMRALSVPPHRSETHTVEGLEVSGYSVVPGFFEFFDIRLVAGRFLSAEDPDEAVVVSKNMADALWPGVSDPIGRTFRVADDPMVRQVVGVTRDVRTPLRDPRTDTPEFFRAYRRPGPNYVHEGNRWREALRREGCRGGALGASESTSFARCNGSMTCMRTSSNARNWRRSPPEVSRCSGCSSARPACSAC